MARRANSVLRKPITEKAETPIVEAAAGVPVA